MQPICTDFRMNYPPAVNRPSLERGRAYESTRWTFHRVIRLKIKGRGMMIKAKKALKREVLPAKKQKLVARAKQLDQEIRREVGSLDRSMTKLAGMLAKMRAEHLWQYLRGFRKFEDYAQHVLGKMARSKVFNLVAIHGLTEGPDPIPAEMVERLGRKTAVELARLSPEERTPDMVK